MRTFRTVLVVGVFLLMLGAILYPVLFQATTGHRKVPCISHLKQLSLGILMYAGDYDDRLPLRDKWLDVSLVSLNDTGRPGETRGRRIQDLRCDIVDKQKLPGVGYAFNSILDKKPTTAIDHPETMPMIYDSINYGANASDPLLSLPEPGRHEGRNGICFVDGHAAYKNIENIARQ